MQENLITSTYGVSRKLVRGAVLICAIAVLLQAQSYQGGFRGAVTDPQGASVSGAKVTLTNQGTGVERSTITNADGTYVFSDVDPGGYSVSAESPNFKKYEQKGITLGTQQFLTVDMRLDVGNVTQSVTVNEDVPLVENSNASQGQVLDQQQQVDLPNLGRNPFTLSRVAANVTPAGNPAYNRMEDQSGSSQISIAGGPVRGNNYLLDGVPITDADNRAMIIPSIEAVQEVKVQANTYDASMARTGGGMFNTLLKSGTNEYHGVAYGSTRQTDWSANNFFNNAAGVPLPAQWNYTYALALGGRVWIPKLYDGKNKTFFWIAREGYDDTQAYTSTSYTPTALERVGDFSQTRTQSGGQLTIYDPLSTVKDPVTGAVISRTPFANNIIPSSRLNPVGSAMAQTFVNPTSTPRYYGDTDLTAPSTLPARAHQTTFKLDENFREWWHANLSYLSYLSLEPGNTYFNTVSSPDQWRLLRTVNATQLNNTFTLSPTSVLNVRYGFNRFPNYGYQVSSGFNLASLGFSPTFTNEVISPVFPQVNMSTAYNSLGGMGTNNDFNYTHYSYNFSSSYSKFLGRHSITAGFDWRQIHTAGLDYGNGGGQFTFNGIFTASSNVGGVGGADLADMLVGTPHDANITVPTYLNDYAKYYGGYIQDDFRLSSKITLNLGLRWEHESGLQEQHNGLVTSFAPNVPSPIQSTVAGLTANGVVEFAGQDHSKTSIGNPNWSKWGPRAGIAWQLNDKTVIRGGYGLYWAPPFGLGAPIQTAGYYATTINTFTNDGYATPNGTLSNPFPNGVNQPAGSSLGTSAGIGQNINLADPYSRSPRVQQFSVDVQRKLPGGVALEVGYVGSRSSHLTTMSGNLNINALNPSYFGLGYDALTTSVPNPLHGAISSSSNFGGPTVQQYQLLQPYPQFGEVLLSLSDQNHAKYDSMIVKAQKRMSNGLTFLSAFTWSRTFDEGSGGPGNSLNGGNASVPQNPYNVAAEWSPAYYDAPLRWANTVTYELPFGKGKPFLGSRGAFVNYLVGGWSFNAIGTYQTGFPLQIKQNTNNNSLFGYGVQRPNATGVSASTSGSLESRLNNYINAAAFSEAPALTFGNTARTLGVRGPGQANWDMSLFKDFKFGERYNAQFRTALLNAFNTPLFNSPGTSYGSSSFGIISSQANFSRMVELGVRLFF
ncbi:MAG: TonB-dependent receptor [Bryobacterales bacterium]|nr:TonB-dependent receptor [Bryobacterales bacterium]